jgi:hypothetical protein
MREGMLWFDNSDQRELSAKIDRAAQYYRTKYGAWPTLCFINPTMMLNGSTKVEGIEVRTTNSVLPNHFWLGTADPQSKRPAA